MDKTASAKYLHQTAPIFLASLSTGLPGAGEHGCAKRPSEIEAETDQPETALGQERSSASCADQLGKVRTDAKSCCLQPQNIYLAAGTFTANTNLWPSRLMLFRFPFSGPGTLNTTFGAAD